MITKKIVTINIDPELWTKFLLQSKLIKVSASQRIENYIRKRIEQQNEIPE